MGEKDKLPKQLCQIKQNRPHLSHSMYSCLWILRTPHEEGLPELRYNFSENGNHTLNSHMSKWFMGITETEMTTLSIKSTRSDTIRSLASALSKNNL